MKMIANHTEGQSNWLVGSGTEKTTRVLSRLYTRGHVGPLWEHMIR